MADAILKPIASAVGKKLFSLAEVRVKACYRARVRDSRTIRKTCLVLPFHAGKTKMTTELRERFSEFHVVDLDLLARAAQSTPDRQLACSARETGDLIAYENLMATPLTKVYEEFKVSSKNHRGTKFLFLTSVLPWAERAFKTSSIIVAAPSSKLFDDIKTKIVASVRASERSDDDAVDVVNAADAGESKEAKALACEHKMREAWRASVRHPREINLFDDFGELVASIQAALDLKLKY